MLVGGRMLASAAHTGFESISGTRDKHTGGSKRVPTLVHLNQDQPSIQGDEQPFQYWPIADHPIKLFTRIWVFSLWKKLASPVLPIVKDFHQGYKELQSNQSLHTRFYLFPSSIDNIWL